MPFSFWSSRRCLVELADLWSGKTQEIADNQPVTLLEVAGLLHRVIVCCDCGLVHKMTIDPGKQEAYFVREDGSEARLIRKRARESGHQFPFQPAEEEPDNGTR